MKRVIQVALPALALAAGVAASAQDRKDAFNDGKAQKSKTPAIDQNIKSSNASETPGYDQKTNDDLQGLYGSDLISGGSSKATTCENYKPGTDAYANQECGTINWARKNPSERPPYTINRDTDPLIVNGTVIIGAPDPYVSPMTAVEGDYTSCKDVQTGTPGVTTTERCNAGQEVREGYCTHTLRVTYSWQVFAGQQGADTRYGRCQGSDVRGDLLTLPQTNTYVTEDAACADYNHGTGTGQVTRSLDCFGNSKYFYFDASRCTVKNSPDDVMPDKVVRSCTDAPRVPENCFAADGHFTSKATVPVFTDTVDTSNCAELNANGRLSK